MTFEEIQAAQVLSIYRDLLNRRAQLQAMTGLLGIAGFTREAGTSNLKCIDGAEFGLSDDDMFVALKNLAARRLADKIAAYRGLLSTYYTAETLREIDEEAAREAAVLLAASMQGPGLSNEPVEDREIGGEGVAA